MSHGRQNGHTRIIHAAGYVIPAYATAARDIAAAGLQATKHHSLKLRWHRWIFTPCGTMDSRRKHGKSRVRITVELTNHMRATCHVEVFLTDHTWERGRVRITCNSSLSGFESAAFEVVRDYDGTTRLRELTPAASESIFRSNPEPDYLAFDRR